MQTTAFMIELKDPSTSNEVAGLLPYDARSILDGGKYIPVPARIAEKILHPLRKGYILKISDRLKENIGGYVSMDDFEVIEPTDFQQMQIQEIAKSYDTFGVQLSRTSILKHFAYFSTAILLAEHGFLITQDNREEKYLEIINTGDEFLLRTLEDYLEARDNLSELSNSYREFRNYIAQLKNAETIEELEEIKKERPF
jgi:hypothetical protein